MTKNYSLRQSSYAHKLTTMNKLLCVIFVAAALVLLKL